MQLAGATKLYASLLIDTAARSHLGLGRPIAIALQALVWLLDLLSAGARSSDTGLLLLARLVAKHLLVHRVRLVGVIGLLGVGSLNCRMCVPIRHPHLRLLS